MTDQIALATKIWPIIFSGGVGSRLWPLSRADYPKQLLPLFSEKSLLQDTFCRVSNHALFHPPYILSNEKQRFIVAEQIRELDAPCSGILLEPVMRNTAPAAAIAAFEVLAQDPDGLMLILPSDHVIQDQGAFLQAIETGIRAARAHCLVTFGAQPNRPETGYGYIRLGDAVADAPGSFRVEKFTEKPSQAVAQRYLREGQYVWNCGIFLFPARLYLDELEKHSPAMIAACQAAHTKAQADLSFTRLDADAFQSSPANSIDYAVMEHTTLGAVVPLDMGWSDVGSWSALWDIATKDQNNNALVGDVIAEQVSGSYLRSEGPVIAAVGIKDAVVVATKDAVLVTTLAAAQDVKLVVDRLAQSDRGEHLSSVQVYRPWGSYETTDEGHRFQVKRLIINPGEKISLQKHYHRAEHWIVVQGTAKVTCDDKELLLEENQSTYIPLGAIHRIENPGKVPVHIIEIQTGSYLGEDDIERLEDTYGRD